MYNRTQFCSISKSHFEYSAWIKFMALSHSYSSRSYVNLPTLNSANFMITSTIHLNWEVIYCRVTRKLSLMAHICGQKHFKRKLIALGVLI